ncbi:hypothetical protein [Streptomyces sp. NPDC058751]
MGVTGADLVVFATPLTGRQRQAPAVMFGRPAVDLSEIDPAGRGRIA